MENNKISYSFGENIYKKTFLINDYYQNIKGILKT